MDVTRIPKRRHETDGGDPNAQGFYGIDLRDDLPLVTPTMSAPPPHVVFDPTSPTGTFNLPTRSGFIPLPPNPFAPGKPRRK